MKPASRQLVAAGLASSFLAGDWDPEAMARRGQQASGTDGVWVRDLARAARSAWPDAPRDRPRELADFLAHCPPLVDAFRDAAERGEPPPRISRWTYGTTAMSEMPWPVVPLATVRDLRELVGLGRSELGWFADPRRLERDVNAEALRHYRYRWVAKARGGARLIEAPKPRLRHLQRVLLREILAQVPTHPAVHGFRPGRSAATYAAAHTGQALVIRLDLEDFFGSVVAGRIYGIFRRCGYPEGVAHALTGLMTNSVPRRVWAAAPPPAPELIGAHRRLGADLARPHLPQGAPTSPALANLAALGLDRRLAGLAAADGLAYSRYADDLAFSAPTSRNDAATTRLVATIGAIVADEGFRLNRAKTRVMRAGQRQQLAGVVVNRHPNVARDDYDRLRAILHNAQRDGPASQNRDGHPDFAAHLLGRISWVRHLDAGRGDRLLAAYARIDWSRPP